MFFCTVFILLLLFVIVFFLMFVLFGKKIIFFLLNILYLFFLLLVVAYFTLLERKIMASVQRRTGPRIVGFYGVLQPLVDGIKLLLKELIIPQKANKLLFVFAPLFTLFLSFLNWSVIPFSFTNVIADIDFGLLYILTLSSLNIYGLIISGWSSNSKYAFLGSLRATAQLLSYELSVSFIVLTLVLFTNSFNLIDIVIAQTRYGWFFFSCFPLFLIFLISILAETNRVPFDLAEAEAELVAGYNVEYSSIVFAMFFLAEYANMLLLACLSSLFFFGGWFGGIYSKNNFFFYFVKICCFVVFFILVRSTLPRFRYDQLMLLGWKSLLPLTFGFFIFYFGLLLLLNIKPNTFLFVPLSVF